MYISMSTIPFMATQHTTPRTTSRGFTIVELLIVIVIIAILAAITIVVFNGITNRAENTKTAQAVSQYVKILQMYASQNGVYPTNVAPSATPASFWGCLPSSDTSCGSQGAAPSCFGLNNTGMSDALRTNLQTIATSLPEVSRKAVDCASDKKFLGALLNVTNTGASASIRFVQIGNTPCPSIGGATVTNNSFETNAKSCTATLPNL